MMMILHQQEQEDGPALPVVHRAVLHPVVLHQVVLHREVHQTMDLVVMTVAQTGGTVGGSTDGGSSGGSSTGGTGGSTVYDGECPGASSVERYPSLTTLTFQTLYRGLRPDTGNRTVAENVIIQNTVILILISGHNNMAM